MSAYKLQLWLPKIDPIQQFDPNLTWNKRVRLGFLTHLDSVWLDVKHFQCKMIFHVKYFTMENLNAKLFFLCLAQYKKSYEKEKNGRGRERMDKRIVKGC